MKISFQETNAANLLPNDKAARYLGVSANQLRLSRHTGELFKGVPAPAHKKLGRSVMYHKSALDDWLSSLSTLPDYHNTAEHQPDK